MGSVGYKDRKKPRGVATHLEFRYRGERYRPLLGYDIPTADEKMKRAVAMANTIMASVDSGEVNVISSSSPTLRDIADAHYFPSLRRSDCVDMGRLEKIVDRLCEYFTLPAVDINLAGVNRYVDDRMDEQAANGTVRKEVGVLRRMLSLALAHRIIQHNPCDLVELPEEIRRKRVASAEELRILLDRGNVDMGRMITLAVTIGLRQGKLLSIEKSWIRKHRDNLKWLHPESGTSSLKGVPEAVPLNTLALRALNSGVQVVRGKIFRRWGNERSFKRSWERLLTRCRKDHPSLFRDLRFHDLRHTFSTILKGLGVSYEVRQALLGHSMKGSTGGYSHGSPGFDLQLVDAVYLLNQELESIIRGVGASAHDAVGG